MKKSFLTVTLAASVLALSACSGNNADSEVIVSSEVGDITKNDLYEEMKSSIGDQAVQILMIEKVLSEKYKITDKEVDAEFEKTKEEMGESFDQYLTQNNQTEESFKKVLRLNLLQEKALTDGVEVTDEEIQKSYERKGTELNARHILVADEETAASIKKELDGGKDFAKLAEEKSTDPGSAANGGNLDWFGAGAMVPEFEEAAYNLEVDEISEPVQTQHGFHIIQVLEKRKVENQPALEDQKEAIRTELAVAKSDQAALVPKIATMLKDAKVDIKDEDLKDALDSIMNPEAAPAQ